jgi:hypothetical protein
MPKRLVAVSLVLFLTSFSFAGKKGELETDPVMPDVTARGRALYRISFASKFGV